MVLIGNEYRWLSRAGTYLERTLRMELGGNNRLDMKLNPLLAGIIERLDDIFNEKEKDE